MLVNIKNTDTGELLHEGLEIVDIILGAYEGDNSTIVVLPSGEYLTFSPRELYRIWNGEESPEPEPTPEDETTKALKILLGVE